MKNYAIIGTGAIGGYCAVRLSQAGFNVHCLLRSDYEHVKQNGLVLISGDEKINVRVNAYQNIQDMPVCDVILVTFKTTENNLLENLLPKIMHENTVVVLLQNGIGMEKELAHFISPEKIVGGVPVIKVSKESPGTIRHFGFNTIELAQYYPDVNKEGLTPQVEKLAENFNQAGIKGVAETHLPTVRWKKLTSNMTHNGLSVVLDAFSQELLKHPASYQLICDITKEVILAAESCGAKLPKDFYASRVEGMETFKNMEKSYSSMKEDFDAKRPLELHAIYENPINMAKQKGVSMPLIEKLYQELVYLNDKNLGM